MCILNTFTEVDILYFGCMELKILFDFHKKSQNPVLLLWKKILIPRYLLHWKSVCPVAFCILIPVIQPIFQPPLTP